MIFDTHAHVFVRGLPLAQHCRYIPDYDATPENYITYLDRFGIDAGVLVQPSFLGTDNHYMLEALRRYPTRFRGVAVVEPNVSRAELNEMAQSGVIGIRLNLIGADLPNFALPEWQQLINHVKELGWHVELHRAASDLPNLVRALLKSEVKIVIDHFGLPSQADKQNDPGFQFLLEHAASNNIWVKLSGAYRNGGAATADENVKPLIPLLLQHFGPSHLLWGSDWPHTRFEDTFNYQKTFELFKYTIPDVEIRQYILSKSAESLIN
ncbi:amidohydrolase family protein [Enterobacter sp. DTU_2021_1002640_1_SI_PRY_ASU_LCPMC_013]|uniref:amidohydrolase family protein n=1 Tax=Enterobacter sp. DTU_2021_1002640_1_SI_PRY_ASU_LCPMC_013 TaxID=3077940 RepID=UPI0028E81DD1|nr:amidohydrolase family protein [Enterobacter sp. DTU_2021_1002640_1_SI_PRY_ASU_LCPMC_013]WNU99172.1 amidohydrolase family protein [Enterobacter sp. DTU_2021_1002640_1_SI_PRY_ASU_LCPMC_013]